MNFTGTERVVERKGRRRINPLLWYLLLGLLIGVTAMTGVFAGAAVSCSNGGGSLHGLTCFQPVVIGACEDVAGNLYRVPVEAYGLVDS